MEKKSPTLSVCIVTWNSMKFIQDCLESILRQRVFLDNTQVDWTINIVDNGSEDGTVEFIKKNYAQIKILKNVNNLGFCRAYNQAIKMHNSDWVLLLNVDTILEQNFFEEMFKVILTTEERIGALGPKVLRSETVIEDGLPKVLKSNRLDSCGLEIKKSRLVRNIGEGEEDSGQYDDHGEFFGFSGTAIFLKREALEDVKIGEEILDEDFFAYQDDFDLFYRLRNYGWHNLFVSQAKVYHFRSAKMNILKPWQFWQIIRARRSKSLLINYHSYKNHLWALIKNETWLNFLYHSPYIFWLEFKKFIFILFFEQKTLKSIKIFFKLLPKMLFKRKIIMSRKKVNPQELRKWFK
ncbi:MAG TPA: glycosyltransferase family 2 protein [bacterium]|nr:glycosyltransferase family 2 protein [bacterium]